MTPSPRITQAEIARLAGVSQATVSLVLNSRTRDARVSTETEARVHDVMRKWGYVPNLAARNLAGGRNAIIGVYTFESAFPTEQGDFYAPFLAGIEREAEALGLDLLMFTSAGLNRRMYVEGQTRLSLADGSLLLGREPNNEEIRRLSESGYPFVYVGHREIDGLSISYVGADYSTATELATRRLIDLGHTAIAYARVGGGASLPSQDRELGFRAAAKAGNIAISSAPIWRANSIDEAAALLDEATVLGATAIVAEQQVMAEALEAAAIERGLSVPDDLSIAVLGDQIGARGSNRDWSGFTVPGREMGATALRVLTELLDDPTSETRHVVVTCDQVVGATVAQARR